MPTFSEEITPTTTFYLVRHGQTDWNVEKKIQGHADIPLNDTGRNEAVKLASILKDISFAACFSSDLQRAHETALILTSTLSLPIIINTDERLRERNCGHWEGYLYSEYYEATPEEQHGTETGEAMQQRALEFLQQVADQWGENNFLIVTHGGIIRNLILRVLALDCSEEDIETKNTAILKLTYSKGQWSVKELHGINLPLKQLD